MGDGGRADGEKFLLHFSNTPFTNTFFGSPLFLENPKIFFDTIYHVYYLKSMLFKLVELPEFFFQFFGKFVYSTLRTQGVVKQGPFTFCATRYIGTFML